jgi:asparagine synthase (glutamine-hydrolysing)
LIFAHRRLSIVDLAGGWQPVSNETGTVWVAYNGEIYNHAALRVELEALGHRFSTRSDTEMIVHAYEAWGREGFARFDGIFAFALWDATQQLLLLARDPLGVKPLYYADGPKGLWFASEVKAAIEAGLYAPAVHLPALELYLTYRFVPSPETLFRGIRRVPPGHWVAANAQGGTWSDPGRFTPFPAPQDERASLGDWVENLTAATRRAVDLQRMADVPFGALLSGGLDSSVVVAVMKYLQTDPVATYAIGFGGAESELPIARSAASALGTAHHEVVVDESRFFADWVDTICQLDEPIASPGHALVGLLCRRVSRDLKVVLTGQGADEPLGGYLRHSPERWIHLLGRGPLPALLRFAARRAAANERVQRLAAVACEPDLEQRVVSAFTLFTAAQRRELLGSRVPDAGEPDSAVHPVRRWLTGTEGLDSLNRLLYVDARLSLADDLLLGSDKVSMAHSVEARVPYLDLEYLAVAERIPGRYKISWHSGRKHLQRLVARRLLPKAMARRLAAPGAGWRRKRGFEVPLRRWFQGPLGRLLGQTLTGPEAALPAYFDRRALQKLLDAHADGRADHTRRLSALLTLEAWHRSIIQGDRDSLRQLDPSGAVPRG